MLQSSWHIDEIFDTAPDISLVTLSDLVPQYSSTNPSPSLSLLSSQESLSAIKGLIRSVGSFAVTELFKGKYDNDKISNTVEEAINLFFNEVEDTIPEFMP